MAFMPGDTDAEIDQSFAPRTAESVGDENGDRELSSLLQFAMKFSRGTVGIGGKKQSVASPINIGDIDSAVGADETMMRFRDKHTILTADDGCGSRARRAR